MILEIGTNSQMTTWALTCTSSSLSQGTNSNFLRVFSPLSNKLWARGSQLTICFGCSWRMKLQLRLKLRNLIRLSLMIQWEWYTSKKGNKLLIKEVHLRIRGLDQETRKIPAHPLPRPLLEICLLVSNSHSSLIKKCSLFPLDPTY